MVRTNLPFATMHYKPLRLGNKSRDEFRALLITTSQKSGAKVRKKIQIRKQFSRNLSINGNPDRLPPPHSVISTKRIFPPPCHLDQAYLSSTLSSRPSVPSLHPVITTKQSAWRDLLNLRRRYFGFAKRESRRDYCIGDIGYLDGTEDNLVLQEVADFFY